MTQAQRIAVLHGGALGDLILTLRLTGALRRRFDPVALSLYARIDLSGLAGGSYLVRAVGPGSAITRTHRISLLR